MVPFVDDEFLYTQVPTGCHQWDQGIHARYTIGGYVQDIFLKFYEICSDTSAQSIV